MWVVFPPGAADMSRIYSPGWGSIAIIGRRLAADCRMYIPAKYSVVAPIGTLEEFILRQYGEILSRVSRLTPFSINFWANYFLFVFKVLTRIVIGL